MHVQVLKACPPPSDPLAVASKGPKQTKTAYEVVYHTEPSVTPASKEVKRIKTCKGGHSFESDTSNCSRGPITSKCKDCECLRSGAIVSKFNLSNNFMPIPSLFMAFSLLSKEQSRLNLVDPKGRCWPVRLGHKHTTKGIGLGWLDFVGANRLESGDQCSFELEEGEKNLMRIQIFKDAWQIPCTPPGFEGSYKASMDAQRIKACKEGHIFEKACKNYSRGSIISCCKDCKCFRFEACMSQFNIIYPYMQITRLFVASSGLSLLEEQNRFTPVNPNGRRWAVSLMHKQKTGESGYETYCKRLATVRL